MQPSNDLALLFGSGQTAAVAGVADSAMQAAIARGRELARLAVDEMVEEIQRRAADHQLDRGLRLSLPYFDDRRLTLRRRDFTVIPRGRVLFVPAFVVIAIDRETGRVADDRQYTPTTRRHVLDLLERMRLAFAGGQPEDRESLSQ
jgi:hypothetical protein